MDQNTLETLISEGLSTTEIGTRLNYSPTNVRYWLRKYNLNTKYIASQDSVCACGAALKGKQTKFCSKACKGEEYSDNPNNYIVQQNRARSRKAQLVKIKGGCCESCGYKKNYAALVFHHKNSSNKLFNIDARKCSNTNWEQLLKELEKCSLLCQNCHLELHNPTLIIEEVGT